MLAGYDNLKATLKKLHEKGGLSHSYIFFGEPQVGKYSFAVSLAGFLEKGDFEAKDVLLTEALIVKPGEQGTIGIDEIRGLKHFLAQKPVNSQRRVAIIDNAESLTAHAQNAILKIAEEPPGSSLLIVVVSNIEALLETLRSRFQKIYFPRFDAEEIAEILTKEYGVKKADAEKYAELSLGRPGRAIELVTNEESQEAHKEVRELLSRKKGKQDIIARLVENPREINPFFTNLIAELAKEPVKNHDALKTISNRIAKMSQFTTNRRLQLESALWNI